MLNRLAVIFRVVILDRMNAVTRILNAIEQGEPHAANQLLPLVYDELRRLAAQKLAREASGQPLQATALVHEAYLRLVHDGGRVRIEMMHSPTGQTARTRKVRLANVVTHCFSA